MNGALPPSSSETFCIVVAACRHQLLADRGRAGEARACAPGVGSQLLADDGAPGPSAVTMLSTPAGSPARVGQGRDRERRQRGLVGGLHTIVLPAASAGPPCG